MIEKIRLDNILFLDIETVPEQDNFQNLDKEMQYLWELKTQYQRKEDYTPEDFYERAGIWAEFGKIVCISVGYIITKGDIRNFRVTSFFGEEKKILLDFNNLLNNHFNLSEDAIIMDFLEDLCKALPFIVKQQEILKSIPSELLAIIKMLMEL